MWKQLHTDETGCRQKQLVNVVINIINEAGDFQSICLSKSIIAEDSTTEEQSQAIIASFGKAGQLLREWKEVMLQMLPSRHDLLDMIPEPEDMSPTKLLGGIVSTDTCNTARLTRQTLCNAIIQKGRDWTMKSLQCIKVTVTNICRTFLSMLVQITYHQS